MTPSDIDPADASAGDAVREQPPRPGHAANRLVPEAVAARFLRIGERYFLPDRSLAFVDGGTRLQVLTHNLDVVHGVVAIMQARGWRQVQVTGAPAFRQLLWREATLQGIEVHGHRPGALELQQLERAKARSRTAAHPPAPDPVGAEVAASAPGAGPGPAGDGPARGGGRAPVRGILLAHAAAPYRFDPAQRLSYYARVRTAAGERTLWGADLERAIAESRSGVQVGDEVVVRPRGARPVAVRVAQRNEAGERVGERKVVVSRTAWTVETARHLEALQRKAEMVRGGHLPAGALLARDPELASAVAGLRLAAQFAQRVAPRADDQARIVDAIREGLARALAEGDRIRLPAFRSRERGAPERGRPPRAIDGPAPARA
ncbi:LPD7 domain-containing protein [Variovorax sp. EBFNA2]|uniref:LPD7 domain-containing protein n=1 Tax=Variovorax sp. EBFNA2 TaxID=3342097 RepID=UPI0029C0F1D0|nr:LPD7 domain-containing protein [Variovorax boronicumulans]WPG40954.1 LPD7 domain-containing protein [Variovorax boronicumulans]